MNGFIKKISAVTIVLASVLALSVGHTDPAFAWSGGGGSGGSGHGGGPQPLQQAPKKAGLAARRMYFRWPAAGVHDIVRLDLTKVDAQNTEMQEWKKIDHPGDTFGEASSVRFQMVPANSPGGDPSITIVDYTIRDTTSTDGGTYPMHPVK